MREGLTQGRRAGAFTLIELLIVVAIIAILAAIAVPNFLEAQTRSRIARVQSDLRSLAGALETYRLDANQYPPSPVPKGVPGQMAETWRLSTPVAYVSAVPVDIFVKPPGNPSPYLGGPFGLGGLWLHYVSGKNESQLDEEWLAFSYGPDGDMEPDAVRYDATNGTVSNGDLYRIGAPTARNPAVVVR